MCLKLSYFYLFILPATSFFHVYIESFYIIAFFFHFLSLFLWPSVGPASRPVIMNIDEESYQSRKKDFKHFLCESWRPSSSLAYLYEEEEDGYGYNEEGEGRKMGSNRGVGDVDGMGRREEEVEVVANRTIAIANEGESQSVIIYKQCAALSSLIHVCINMIVYSSMYVDMFLVISVSLESYVCLHSLFFFFSPSYFTC